MKFHELRPITRPFESDMITKPRADLSAINAELLEALEIALPYIEQACSCGDYINDEEFQGFAALLSVESAIAKAKGES